MPDLGNDNPASPVGDNPLGPSSDASLGTGATNGQAGYSQDNGLANDGRTPAGGDAPDIFKGIDPQKLSPENRESYNQMLRDYRDKTAKLSETTKSEVERATQAYRDKASLYDQIATQEEFVKQWNDYVEKTRNQTGQSPQAGDPVLADLKAQINEVTQKMQVAELSELTTAFAEAANEKGERLHPEFDSLNSIMIGKIQDGLNADEYSLLRGCLELAPGNTPQERLASGYKTAKAVYDQIFDAGRKAGMGRLNQKVLNGSIPPTSGGGDALTLTEKKPKNAHEALAMAKRGQVVSRDN